MTDDLFGAAPDQPDAQTLKRRAASEPRGYVAQPGTGPAGETCKTCQHYTIRQLSKTYRKCGLMRARWSGGPRTDIKASSPACSKWQRADESEVQP